MKKETRVLLILTGCIFLVLAGLLAARFTPGSNPLMHRITMLVLSPAILVVHIIGHLRLWPFSEKADVPMACLLGVLTPLTSFLYASAVLAGIKLIKKLTRRGRAEQSHGEATSEASHA